MLSSTHILSSRRVSRLTAVFAAVAALLQLDAVRKPLAQAVPLMVNLITPPRPEPPQSKPREPKPATPQAPRIEPLPLLTVEAQVHSHVVVPPQPRPAPVAPPIAAVVAPAPVHAANPALAPSAAPAPLPIQPPSFDAAYLRNPPPVYPALSRRRGEAGQAVLRVFVNAQGTAQQVELRQSSGFERLDQAALDAVRQWRFVPARQGEQAVAAWVLVPIQFALEN